MWQVSQQQQTGFHKSGKNIFNSLVGFTRCENQPSGLQGVHGTVKVLHGHTCWWLPREQKAQTGCAGASVHTQDKRTVRQIFRHQIPSVKTLCFGKPWMQREVLGHQAKSASGAALLMGWLQPEQFKAIPCVILSCLGDSSALCSGQKLRTEERSCYSSCLPPLGPVCP